MEIDKGKKRTLERLRDKKESAPNYAIDASDLLITQGCDLCGSEDTSRIAEVYLNKGLNFFTTDVCNDCTYVFRGISPGFEWFQKRWKQIASDKPEVFNPEIEAIRKKRYEEYLQVLLKHISSGKTLDVGSAYGTGAQVFRDAGFDVQAIEPEDNKANYIEKARRIPVVGNSVEEFLARKSDYDLILFAHCLEHLDNPNIISDFRKILNPNGIMYLEVPVLWNHVNWSDALYLTHKSNFTPENLVNLVSKNGFSVLQQTHFRHSEEEPVDFGLVLRQDATDTTELQRDKNHTLEDVFKLYRKGLSVNVPTNKILKYNVNGIEHFYQTLRLDRKTALLDSDGFISFHQTD